MFSLEEFHGFDGEMILGEDPVAADLCRLTSGAMRRHDSVNTFTWYLFDYITEETEDLPYVKRMEKLAEYLNTTLKDHPLRKSLRVVPSVTVEDEEKMLWWDDYFLNKGFEGSILRDPNGLYKHGRSDAKMQVWRIKRFIDAEFIIDEIIEGETNGNEAVINELGRTERSSHKENMQPNGLVGAFKGRLLKDVLDPQTSAIIIPQGTEIVVSAGKLSHEERKYYFDNKSKIVGEIGKFKLFPKGTKDKPRFPVFDSIRSKEDM
jgi:DNA ligase-1